MLRNWNLRNMKNPHALSFGYADEPRVQKLRRGQRLTDGEDVQFLRGSPLTRDRQEHLKLIGGDWETHERMSRANETGDQRRPAGWRRAG